MTYSNFFSTTAVAVASTGAYKAFQSSSSLLQSAAGNNQVLLEITAKLFAQANIPHQYYV